MPYSTVEDMIYLFGLPEMVQLSNLDNPGVQEVNGFRIETAIESADSIIDSYLSAQVALPIPDAVEGAADGWEVVRRILKSKSMDIARYVLESRGEPRPDVKVRYDLALQWLQMVSKGEIEIAGGSNGETGDGSSDGAIAYSADPRVFTRATLRGYTENWGRFAIDD